MTGPLVQRLRSELMAGVVRYRRRRRWRPGVVAVVAVAASAGAIVLNDGEGSDTRVSSGDVTTSSGDTSTTSTAPRTSQPVITAEGTAEATTVVEQFLDHLRRGDLVAPAALWTGYPETSPISPIDDEKIAAIERLLIELEWLATAPALETSVTPPPPFPPFPDEFVVTVVSNPAPGEPRQAAAFVVRSDAGSSSPSAGQIERLPDASFDVSPPPGASVSPGDRVVVPTVPVEGAVNAFVDGVEVAALVDHEAITTTVEIPSWAQNEVVVTVAFATPEIPLAIAVVYRIA